MSNQSIKKFLQYCSIYKETDSGRNGKAFERAIKWAITGQDLPVSPVGEIDLEHNGYTYEIKSGAGELPDTFGKDFVIYCPQVCDTIAPEMQGFVFTAIEWQEFLNGYPSMVATKKSTHGTYRQVLQPLAVSRKMSEYIWDTCYNRPTVKEFFNI